MGLSTRGPTRAARFVKLSPWFELRRRAVVTASRTPDRVWARQVPVEGFTLMEGHDRGPTNLADTAPWRLCRTCAVHPPNLWNQPAMKIDFGEATPRWQGGKVRPKIHCVLAGNPGPMTLEGTNTWVLGAVGASHVIVLDPGPDDAAHAAAVVHQVRSLGARAVTIALTHGHDDHNGAVSALVAAMGAELWAPVAEGATLARGEVRLQAVPTPGHTADSVSWWWGEQGVLFTGDTILGRGTAVVAHPGGDLGDYLASLERLQALVRSAEVSVLLPGHGPPVDDPAGVVAGYLEHRLRRLDQVHAALQAGAGSVAEVVAVVYAGIDPALRPAAALTVAAHVAYLRARGDGGGGAGWAP